MFLSRPLVSSLCAKVRLLLVRTILYLDGTVKKLGYLLVVQHKIFGTENK